MSGFLPSSDAALLAWSLNFSTRITATPTAYGLTAPLATSYSALHTSFATALAACDPEERNQITTATKNAARYALENQARLLAKLVQGTATVTDAQKLELGLNVRVLPTPIPPPAFAPGITILSTTGNTVRLRLSDADSPTRRGRPPYVDGAAVFSFVGPAAPAEESDWKFEGNVAQIILDIAFPTALAAGTRVWFTAYWFNQRKERGPAATPVSTTLAGGAALAA